ncbi:hypothetical protein D3C77_442290 [compost metagenome]
MIAGKASGYPHQLVTVESQVNCLFMVCVDPRPDDVAVFAAILDVEHDGARLIAETQCVFSAADVIHVLVAGERTLRGIWVNGKAVEIFFAAGQGFGLHLPFLECTVQVLGYRAA